MKKFESYFLALDRKFKITQNDIIKTFDQLPKNNLQILAVDQNFLKAKMTLIKVTMQKKIQNLINNPYST